MIYQINKISIFNQILQVLLHNPGFFYPGGINDRMELSRDSDEVQNRGIE